MRYVNFGTAKELKELGYNEPCMDYYLNKKFNGRNKDGSSPESTPHITTHWNMHKKVIDDILNHKYFIPIARKLHGF